MERNIPGALIVPSIQCTCPSLSIVFVLPTICPPWHSLAWLFVGMVVPVVHHPSIHRPHHLLSRLFVIPHLWLLSSSAPPIPLWAVAHMWVGGACDVAVVAHHPEMGPIATLWAEAHSGGIGHRWGVLRAQVCCMVARQHCFQKIRN